MTAKPRLVVPTGIVVLLLCARPVSAQLQASVYASGFSSPVAFVQDPSDATVHYVVEQAGLIRVIRNRVVQSTPFLSVAHLIVSGGEQGLLGLAFPPNYGASGRFYVSFTRAPDGQTVVARFKRSSNPLVADPASYFPLVWSADPDPGEVDSVPQPFIPQPFANHNGGTIAFGPDGFLYVARGDGGSANDPQNNAQNTTELLGKILRIDVNVSESHARGFVVPAGNAGLPRPEIWSIGLRNPWKFTFDDPSRGGTGAMLIGDVGQGAIEEIDYEPAGRSGRNYGWRNYEGTRSNITTPSPVSAPIFPIFEYGRTAGRSVTGGYVYRGVSMPTMRGRYFWADFATSRVWSLLLTVQPSTGEATASALVEHTAELGGAAFLGNISSFGVDAAGELYILNYSAGSILRLGTSVPPTTPTGLRIVR
jgi:glucose/arabinose dehydrogenase